MLPPETYVPFDDTNREHIDNIINSRWRKYRTPLIFSLLLPLLALGSVIVCLALYVIIVVINGIYAQRRFKDLFADRKRGEKLVIPFYANPYCIPEVGRYYIKTDIPLYPYITIDQETYYWMDPSQVLYMEVAPKSEIIFNILTTEELPDEIYPIFKTPHQQENER